jgi:hypothetical protein
MHLNSLAVVAATIFPASVPVVSAPLLANCATIARRGLATPSLLMPGQPAVPGGAAGGREVRRPRGRHDVEHLVASAAILATGANARLAALDRSGHSLLIYARQSDGTWRLREQVDLPASTHATRLAAGDLNGDGADDLAVADASAGRLFLFAAGADRLAPRRDFVLPPTLSAGELLLTDLTGDGRADVLLVDVFAGVVNVLQPADSRHRLDPVRATAVGRRAARRSVSAARRASAFEPQPVAVLVRDFTGDGARRCWSSAPLEHARPVGGVRPVSSTRDAPACSRPISPRHDGR